MKQPSTVAELRNHLVSNSDEMGGREMYTLAANLLLKSGFKMPPSEDVLRLSLEFSKMSGKDISLYMRDLGQLGHLSSAFALLQEVLRGLNSMALIAVTAEEM